MQISIKKPGNQWLVRKERRNLSLNLEEEVKVFKRLGITQLEFAIILIAFVVVAAIIAFTVLSTGEFLVDQARPTPDPAIQSCFSGWDGKTMFVQYRSRDGWRTIPIDPKTAKEAVCKWDLQGARKEFGEAKNKNAFPDNRLCRKAYPLQAFAIFSSFLYRCVSVLMRLVGYSRSKPKRPKGKN